MNFEINEDTIQYNGRLRVGVKDSIEAVTVYGFLDTIAYGHYMIMFNQ